MSGHREGTIGEVADEVAPAGLLPHRRFEISARLGRIVALVVAALLALTAIAIVVADRDSIAADQSYQSHRSQLLADLGNAKSQGYTDADLAPITTQLDALDRSEAPFWIGDRGRFSQDRDLQVQKLDSDLKSHESDLLKQAQDGLAQQLASVKSGIDHDRQIDTPDLQLTPLSQRLDKLAADQAKAAGIRDFRAAGKIATGLLGEVTAAGNLQEQENAAIQQAAASLSAQLGGNVDAIRRRGNDALASGRNDASVAAYEAKGNRFDKSDDLMATYNRLEHYSGRLGGTDVNAVAFSAAALARYAGDIHGKMIAGLHPKHIIVSFEMQHMWAFENGKVVMETPVTTGIRGVTEYGTDFGPMKILRRAHPWKMHSPFPKGSQYWYPDTMVQWTAFFTNSGESFHDASWEADSELGPGSQYTAGTRSHGCIHIPYGDARWMYYWAVEGTPVDVFPGDGSPVASQLSLMTTDNQGNPLNPA